MITHGKSLLPLKAKEYISFRKNNDKQEMVPILAQTNTSSLYLCHRRKQKTKWEKL